LNYNEVKWLEKLHPAFKSFSHLVLLLYFKIFKISTKSQHMIENLFSFPQNLDQVWFVIKIILIIVQVSVYGNTTGRISSFKTMNHINVSVLFVYLTMYYFLLTWPLMGCCYMLEHTQKLFFDRKESKNLWCANTWLLHIKKWTNKLMYILYWNWCCFFLYKLLCISIYIPLETLDVIWCFVLFLVLGIVCLFIFLYEAIRCLHT
jgi:hypothetical protein